MKRTYTLLLAVVMLIVLFSGCNSNDFESVSSYTSVSSDVVATDISNNGNTESDNTIDGISADSKETSESKTVNDSTNTDNSKTSTEKSTASKPSATESQASKPNSSGTTTESRAADTSSNPAESNTMVNINIIVGGSVFAVKIYNNDATRALLTQFPMTINMSDLNGNEKYYYLADNLPVDSQRVGNIKVGDLMLYGSNCLVLFYESFSTSYNYTKLGYIEDASGLAAALGSGSVKVTFAVSD